MLAGNPGHYWEIKRKYYPEFDHPTRALKNIPQVRLDILIMDVGKRLITEDFRKHFKNND